MRRTTHPGLLTKRGIKPSTAFLNSDQGSIRSRAICACAAARHHYGVFITPCMGTCDINWSSRQSTGHDRMNSSGNPPFASSQWPDLRFSYVAVNMCIVGLLVALNLTFLLVQINGTSYSSLWQQPFTTRFIVAHVLVGSQPLFIKQMLTYYYQIGNCAVHVALALAFLGCFI